RRTIDVRDVSAGAGASIGNALLAAAGAGTRNAEVFAFAVVAEGGDLLRFRHRRQTFLTFEQPQCGQQQWFPAWAWETSAPIATNVIIQSVFMTRFPLRRSSSFRDVAHAGRAFSLQRGCVVAQARHQRSCDARAIGPRNYPGACCSYRLPLLRNCGLIRI